MVLPIDLPNSSKVLKVASDVVGILITSRSFITGTGLKKCKPPNLSLRTTGLAISSIERDDVLLANMAPLIIKMIKKQRLFMIKTYFGAILSNCEKSECFASIFSTIASITKSVLAAPSSKETVDFIRLNTSSKCFSPAFKKEFKQFLLKIQFKLLLDLFQIFS